MQRSSLKSWRERFDNGSEDDGCMGNEKWETAKSIVSVRVWRDGEIRKMGWNRLV